MIAIQMYLWATALLLAVTLYFITKEYLRDLRVGKLEKQVARLVLVGSSEMNEWEIHCHLWDIAAKELVLDVDRVSDLDAYEIWLGVCLAEGRAVVDN